MLVVPQMETWPNPTDVGDLISTADIDFFYFFLKKLGPTTTHSSSASHQKRGIEVTVGEEGKMQGDRVTQQCVRECRNWVALGLHHRMEVYGKHGLDTSSRSWSSATLR